MKNSTSDFFGASQTPGSSPAATLAADLSQNFYIDRRWVINGQKGPWFHMADFNLQSPGGHSASITVHGEAARCSRSR